MGAYPSYTCTICKGKFQFGDIRYSSDGKRIVCRGCYDKVKKDGSIKKKKIEIELKICKKSDAIKLICIDCRYKFSWSKASRINLICPYCGSKRLMKNENTAEKLVEEASQSSDYYVDRQIRKFNK